MTLPPCSSLILEPLFPYPQPNLHISILPNAFTRPLGYFSAVVRWSLHISSLPRLISSCSLFLMIITRVLLLIREWCRMDPYLVNPCFSLGESPKMQGSMPFELCHGGSMWEVAAKNLSLFKGLTLPWLVIAISLMSSIVAQYPLMFQGLKSLIDVGGGVGGCAWTIAKACPYLNVKVWDLPHVAE